mmetsp:Transcript_46824/g.95765  ORF Transcript_46824/g.95765 Transcript_46824/m.95765 type:complete len:1109 (-) Transcript_46824:511-3837(-)
MDIDEIQNDMPRKHNLDKTFTTKTLKQQLDERLEKEMRKDVTPPQYAETVDDDDVDEINKYTPQTSKEKLKEIHIWPSNKHFRGTDAQATLGKWHERSGHINDQYLLKVAPHTKGMEEVARLSKHTQSHHCDACHRANSKRKRKHKHISRRYKEVMYKLHTDMSGKIRTPSTQGASYYVVFIDDASGYKFVSLLKTKDQFIKALDQLCVRLGRYPRVLRMDNAGEMVGGEAEAFYTKHRIATEKCSPREHDQNPRAEAAVGNIGRRARTLLIHANAPKRYWGHCIYYACELENRFLPFMTGSNRTCYEAFHGEQPDNTFIKTWGCRAYLNIEKHNRHDQKNDDTAISCVFLGTAFHLGYKAFLLGSLDGKRLYISRYNVTIDETSFPWRDKTKGDAFQITSTGEKLEELETEECNELVEEPEIVVDLDVHEDLKIVDDAFEEQVRTRSQTRALETEEKQNARAESDVEKALQAANDNARREALRSLPSEPQTIHTLAAEIAAEIAPSTPATRPVFSELSDKADDFLEQVKRFVGKPSKRVTRSMSQQQQHNAYTFYNRRHNPHHINLHSLLPLITTRGIDVEHTQMYGYITLNDEPKSIPEALKRDDREKWWEAVMEEVGSWEALGVYDVVDIPKGIKPITSKIVFKLKLDKVNNPVRWKARIVARGFQQEDLDTIDTFAPMAHPVTIRTIVALAISNNWSLKQADVKTAYLNATLEEPMYMMPPKGLEEAEGKCWILKRAVYGLGIAGRRWWQLFSQKNKDFGMEAVTHDDCVYSITRGKEVLIVAIVVDDCLMVGNSEALRLDWLKYMNKDFIVSDDGDLQWYLGVNYERHNNDVLAKQTAYSDRCLQKYGLQDAKPKSTPMEPKFSVHPNELPKTPDPKQLEEYRSKVGSLIYLSVWTRPDIAFAVNYLARFMTCPNDKLIKAADRVFRYVKGTREKGIWFRENDKKNLGKNIMAVYADTSDADCPITSKSTGGYIIYINGAPVAWRSGRLPLVTLSSAESEYVQVTLACQEILHLRELLSALGFPQTATAIFEDNQAAIAICNNPCHRTRTRHIARRYHFIRQCIRDGNVYIVYVASADNAADIFTKPVPDPQYKKLVSMVLHE